MAELLRLFVVLALTGGGYTVGERLDVLLALGSPEETRLVTSVMGALVGYLFGGAIGRWVVRHVDTAAARLDQVPSVTLVASVVGAGLGAFVGITLLLPVLLLPFQRFTVPAMLLVVLVLAYAGGRLGAVRGHDLGRFVGMRGRLEVSTPSRGGGVKLVDASALIDGRIVEVARSGYLEGTLVVPTFVLDEIQALADSGAEHRRRAGQRGLNAVQILKDDGLVAMEITDDDVASATDVDAKLATLARTRRAALITADGNLSSVAEVAGIRVLNPHVLADAVRPPVLPGEQVAVRLVKKGREAGQGIGYLDDGTMVVVEAGADSIGLNITVELTSIVQNRQGRMLFGIVSSDDEKA